MTHTTVQTLVAAYSILALATLAYTFTDSDFDRASASYSESRWIARVGMAVVFPYYWLLVATDSK